MYFVFMKDFMLSTIYALLCIIVPCSLYQLIICKRKNKKQENKAIHFVWVYIFLLYIYLTFSVAGIGSIWDIGHYDTIIRLEEINLLPFQSEGIMTYVLNKEKMSIATDIGCITENIRQNLFDSKLVVLESNYDPNMLMMGS